MKNFLTLAVRQAADFAQLCRNFFTIQLSRIDRQIKQLLAPAKIAVSMSFLLLISLFVNPAAAYAQSATLSPQQVVEYALTLEKLEADFYRRAVDAVQSGRLRNVPQIARDALVSYGEDEAQHVTDLSNVLTGLGGDPDAVTIPENPNYNAILRRNPFANLADLLLAGQYVEDLGAAAYKGQVQNLLAGGEAARPILAAALAIHSVEARHAAGIRFLRNAVLGTNVRPWIRNQNEVIYRENRSGSPIPFNTQAFDGYATSDEVLALVRPILSTAQGTTTQQRTNTSNQNNPVPALW